MLHIIHLKKKENIPIEILKNSNKNEMNEIDEEINNTIKEFDNQIHLIQEEIYGKNLKKNKKIKYKICVKKLLKKEFHLILI